jgi:hypothetical protein
MADTDYFAELYVAGRFADAGWNVYFPHRDKGFDFVISKPGRDGRQFLRPVQVKGKYPTGAKTDKRVYGYVGRLSQTHPDMILAIPFFSADSTDMPVCTAYMMRRHIKPSSRGFACQPAMFRGGMPILRRDFAKYFDRSGLLLLMAPKRRSNSPPPPPVAIPVAAILLRPR